MTCQLPSEPPPPPDPDEVTTGPRNGTFFLEQTRADTWTLSDVVRSVHDPERDLLLPALSVQQWQVLTQLPLAAREEVLRALIAWQATTGRAWLLSQPPVTESMARQEAPTRAALEALRAGAAAVCRKYLNGPANLLALFPPECQTMARTDLTITRALDKFIPIFESAFTGVRLQETFLDAAKGRGPVEVNLRSETPWWTADDQRDTAGCVGYAVAGLAWQQARSKEDKPSARFFWQGAKEMDGEERPTTFVVAAGTSVRAALRLGQEYGIAYESQVPSDRLGMHHAAGPRTLDEFYAEIGKRKFAGVTRLSNETKNILAWLSTGRPVLAVIWGDEIFRTKVPQQENAEVPDYNPADPKLFLHAVVIAGFRSREGDLLEGLARADSKDDPNDISALLKVDLLIRNSYGPTWGDQGYAWMSHRQFRRRCTEAYGIWTVNSLPQTGVDMSRLADGPPPKALKEKAAR